MQRVFFITGTDTGAGKTVFSALFTRYLFERGEAVVAFKPLCSGGRGDAWELYLALKKRVSLDAINPWFFKAPLAPLLAARRERQRITLAMVAEHIERMSRDFATVVVEGAGGLLSPMGEDFDSLKLLSALRARPVIVAPNRLGVVNHILLTLAALPKARRDRTPIVLMMSAKADLATKTNVALLREGLPRNVIYSLPWLGKKIDFAAAVKTAAVRRVLAAVGEVT